ncbi:hypothetical protein M9458_006804, partial [Cirrhinus mrigala]
IRVLSQQAAAVVKQEGGHNDLLEQVKADISPPYLGSWTPYWTPNPLSAEPLN